MKKLMIAAAAAAMIGGASAIESANIVGYQEVTVPKLLSLYTVTFKNVDGTKYDIQDIIPLNKDGTAITADRAITIQKLNADGSYAAELYKWRPGKNGWCKSLSAEARGTVLFDDAEAMCVNNTTGGEVVFRVNGEVVVEPWSGEVPKLLSLIGNMTPNQIDLQDIVPYNLDGSAITGDRVITLQKLNSDGSYADELYKWRPSKNAWCKSLSAEARGNVLFAAGEAACVNNNSGASIKFSFKSPIAE